MSFTVLEIPTVRQEGRDHTRAEFVSGGEVPGSIPATLEERESAGAVGKNRNQAGRLAAEGDLDIITGTV